VRWYRIADMDDRASPEEPLRHERLRELVDALPPEQRHVVERVYFGGASITEAGAEIGVTYARAKDHLNDAIQQLRDLLEADEVGPLPADEPQPGDGPVLEPHEMVVLRSAA
jgi:DNA-directed RNA polymerase specialized sigma24 family protein